MRAKGMFDSDCFGKGGVMRFGNPGLANDSNEMRCEISVEIIVKEIKLGR